MWNAPLAAIHIGVFGGPPTIDLYDDMALLPGQKLGPYQILALLGAGGMGQVYSADDTRLHRTVANQYELYS